MKILRARALRLLQQYKGLMLRVRMTKKKLYMYDADECLERIGL
jgi:hypothetical protein